MKVTISKEISFGLLFGLLPYILEGLFEKVAFDFEKDIKVQGSHCDGLALRALIFMTALCATHDLFYLGCHHIKEILRRRTIDLLCLNDR